MTVALVNRTGATVDAVELFGGFGGTAQGVHAAGAEIKVAANHLPIATECYAANFPGTDVRRADLVDVDAADYIDPADLPPARLLLASPSCRYHSRANAHKVYQRGLQASLPGLEDDFDHDAYANSERSRVTMMCVIRYAAKHRPELVMVENVVEVCFWGPDRDGSTFRWWLNEWTKLGYDYEVLFLNSAHFAPCPQRRERCYICFWLKGNRRPDLDYRPDAQCPSDRCGGAMVKAERVWKPRKDTWPLPRWGEYGRQYYYVCPDCRHVVEPLAWPAYSAIDFSNLGHTIGERADAGKPLAPATIERVRRALVRFGSTPPVIVPVTAPFTTQTAQQDKALVVAGSVLPLRSGRPRAGRLVDPLATVVANGPGHALAVHGSLMVAAGNTFERPGSTCRSRSLADQMWTQHATPAMACAWLPALVEMHGGGSIISGQRPVTDPLHTVTAGGMHHGLVAPPALFSKINGGPGDTAWHHIGEPLNTVTAHDTHGLLVLPWLEQWRSDPAAITEQLATVMTHLRHSLCSATPELDPLSDSDLDQVRFRMLEPDPELRRAMAFEDTFILLGNKRQMTAGLGNAVTPPVATWIARQLLATLDGRETKSAA